MVIVDKNERKWYVDVDVDNDNNSHSHPVNKEPTTDYMPQVIMERKKHESDIPIKTGYRGQKRRRKKVINICWWW